MVEPSASAPHGTPDQRRAGAQRWPRLGIIPFALHGIVLNYYCFFGRLSSMIRGADHVKL